MSYEIGGRPSAHSRLRPVDILIIAVSLLFAVWALGGALDKDAHNNALANLPHAILVAAEREPMALTREERDWVEGVLDARYASIEGERVSAEYADAAAVYERLRAIAKKVGLEPTP